MSQHVIVREYDPRYPALYEKETGLISSILGENLVAIHHIGSTAVPGLKSKPVIDIMAAVRSLEDADGKKDELEAIGYECMGEFGIKGRRYLRKGGDERTHQIHVFQEGDRANLMRHLATRDYLIAHEDVREEYGRIKEELALRFPYDIEGYCDGKEAFVRKLEGKALREYVREGKDIGILLRPFGKDRADDLMEMFVLAIQRTCAKDYSEEQREAWASSLGKDALAARLESSFAPLAFLGDRPIGFGNLEGGRHLDLLYVHPDYQGLGAGSMICAALEAHAGGYVHAEASLTARGFFLRRGYSVLREESVLRKGVALPRFRMAKKVPSGGSF